MGTTCIRFLLFADPACCWAQASEPRQRRLLHCYCWFASAGLFSNATMPSSLAVPRIKMPGRVLRPGDTPPPPRYGLPSIPFGGESLAGIVSSWRISESCVQWPDGSLSRLSPSRWLAAIFSLSTRWIAESRCKDHGEASADLPPLARTTMRGTGCTARSLSNEPVADDETDSSTL